MDVSVGTFNLNNLFSRFNFEAQVDAIVEDDPESGLTATYTFNDPERFRLRTYQGRLVHGKNPADQDTIATRIAAMDLDVLCAQEVEDIDTLRFFAAQHLGGSYRYLVLVEGNDPRLIDLAVLSKLPLGAVASHQHAVHREQPAEAVFSRDLLEVDILHPTNGSRLLTLFNNHLKSQFVPFDQDPVAGKEANDTRRRRQAETVERIVAARTRPDSRFLILGDLNDPPDSPSLAAITASEQLRLVNGLAQPAETRPPKADVPPPPASAPGPTASRSPASRPTTSCSTRSGSARPWPPARPAPSSTAAPATAATAATTTRPGSPSPSSPSRPPQTPMVRAAV
jgi:endonuclease/exonuclease/phosphatase family metal-dependent hydrolase